MSKYFLTIDNGGTNTKAIIFDDNGNQINSVSFPTMRIENKPGFHEIDLNDLWNAIGHAIKKVIRTSKIAAQDIIGVSCVGHGKGLYILDNQKRIFTHGILSTDSRAIKEAERFEKDVSKIYPISHQHVMESQSPVLLNWLKNNRTDIYLNIGYVLAAKDFVRERLTGQIFQEYGDASGNNFLNLSTQQYDSRLFNFFDIPEMFSKMPPLKKYNEEVGEITYKAAEDTGLLQGTPVFAGMFDIDACSLATGVVDDDYFSVIAGTWNINVFPSKKLSEISSGLMNSIYPNGLNLIESSSATSAGNLSMTLQSLMSEEINNAKGSGKSIYDILEDFLEHTDASYSKVIFFPFLYGSNVNPDAEGAYIGIQSSTTKSAIIRSVYEGIAFSHRMHIEKLIKVLGHKPLAIRLSGGGTNSAAWVKIFSNIFNIPIQLVSGSELGGLGGAMTSAIGIGLYKNIDEAISKMVHIKKEYVPTYNQVKIYDKKYHMYVKLLNSLDKVWTNLKNMQEEIEEQ
ncbi:FGGY-family carbohydrate kinase [Oenococcus oeni]|uniref:L-xylulose kinase n=4 Tax=Oenococcus oeni TaxID=1247 RepID=A0AAQ2URU9_OENOE|nr:FGGY-family carbohydrate kinase [Oenococcus oeni]EJN98977.1 L-xylulose/3-keto-L-gulonate kinase [Oenococcus oeni AWRIB418]KGH56718.1 carbohydrate kinase [Oenococcus oeni IOEB_B10]KGH63308.1 carbohydrate kinase [Oenococcus oeni S13]OIL35222.1 carbohydrate kinase [Oenococcus oeni]OIM35377.1 carbohydrate kinase [Oenococcus oeni]